LLAAGLAVGSAIGAATVSTGGGDFGAGQYSKGSALGWWTTSGIVYLAALGTPPTSASQTVGTPTVLSTTSGTSYMINTGVSTDKAVEFQFHETTSAPVNTELELQFTVTVNSVVSTVTVYAETQTSAPGSTLTFNLMYDAGAATVTVNNEQQVSQVCSSVGACP
jgi:hypothetical protein